VLKSALTLLIEPLGLLTMAVLLGTAISWRRSGVRSTVLMWGPVLLVMLALTTPLGANALIKPLEDSAVSASQRCRQSSAKTLVIVLGGGFEGTIPTSDEVGSLQIASFRRSLAAANRMASLGEARLLITGSEAGAMQALVTQLGLDADRIMVDSRSNTTAESAIAIRGIADAYGAEKIELMTTALHMRRALASLEREGIVACALAVDFRYKRTSFPGKLLPQASALQKSTEALHEYVGLLYYLLAFSPGRPGRIEEDM